MRRALGLLGVLLAGATVPGSTRVSLVHHGMASCERRAVTAKGGRAADPDAFTPGQVRGMLRDFTETLRRRYGVAGERALEAGRRLAGRLTMPVRLHVITDGRSGRLSPSAIAAQLGALNAAYGGSTGGADTGVSFRLVAADTTVNARWFTWPYQFRAQLGQRLRQGGPGTLNLFTAAVGAQMLGFSSFPQSYRTQPEQDGVVVDYRTLPGGQFEHFNRGYTAVHETGHWLGLFHTFENGCRPPGDGVDDTPYEAVPTQGCPTFKDTCPDPPRPDPIHNFMDYGNDTCMREFTPGQGLRIRAMWAAYRTNGSGRGLSPAQHADRHSL